MIITKQLKRDLKAATALVIRFNGNHSTIDIFEKDYNADVERVVTYQFKDSNSYAGNWHIFVYNDQRSPLTTFINSLMVNDVLYFDIENHESDHLKAAGVVNYQLIGRVKHHRKDGITLSSYKHWFIDAMTQNSNQYTPIKKTTPYINIVNEG